MNFSKFVKASTAMIVLVFNLFILPIQAQNIKYKGKILGVVDSLKKVNVYTGFIGKPSNFWLVAERVAPLFNQKALYWLMKGGVGYARTNVADSYSFILGSAFLFSLNKARNRPFFFEVGLSYIFLNYKEEEGTISTKISNVYTNNLVNNIGFRYQRPQGGFLFYFGVGFPLFYHIRYDMRDPAPWQREHGGNIINTLEDGTVKDVGGFSYDLGIGWTFKHIKRK